MAIAGSQPTEEASSQAAAGGRPGAGQARGLRQSSGLLRFGAFVFDDVVRGHRGRVLFSYRGEQRELAVRRTSLQSVWNWRRMLSLTGLAESTFVADFDGGVGVGVA